MMENTYVFDAYGTLFDVHAAVAKYADPADVNGAKLSQIWRTKQLEYTWVLTGMGRYRSFWDLTQDSLDFALQSVPGFDPALRAKLLEAYFELEAYPEVKSVLQRLKGLGHNTAILSNGSPDMLHAAVKAASIQEDLDAVLSVHDLGVFKPSPRVYDLVGQRFNVEKSKVQFHSSNRWDVAAASAYGFHVKWINRTGAADEYKDLGPDAILPNLSNIAF